MKFAYKARTKEGELQVGNVEASSREAATNTLLGHGLFVLNIEIMERPVFYTRILDIFRRVKVEEMMIFTRQFATLLASSIPLSDALHNLYEQTTRPNLKEVIAELSADINAGFSLSQATERHPTVFSEFYTNMIKSAEVTGRLAEVLDYLADYLEKRSILTSKVRNAMIYPAFVIGLFGIVVMIMVTFVLPQIAPIFEESNISLPFFTQFLLAFGNFIRSWWWIVLIVGSILLLMIIDYFRSVEGKIVFDDISLRLPIMGSFFRKFYVARFAESARVLIQGGLTIPQSIEITSRTIGNNVYRELLRGAAQNIRKGQTLSQALGQTDYFPPLVSQLISVGESTGRLEELLAKVSDFYTRQVEDMVNNLVELIQPILMVVIGVFIALLFASMLLPLYSLTQSF